MIQSYFIKKTKWINCKPVGKVHLKWSDMEVPTGGISFWNNSMVEESKIRSTGMI